MKVTKGRPTGQGYPQHLALYHQGKDGFVMGCVICRTWLGSPTHRATRNGAARFIRKHKHCGLKGVVLP